MYQQVEVSEDNQFETMVIAKENLNISMAYMQRQYMRMLNQCSESVLFDRWFFWFY